LKPRDVARDAEINEGYLSMLISRKRDNPSLDILTRIADAMGVGIDDLRRPPPDKKVLEEISRLSPEQLDRLRRSKQP
jgi:transcriptional regulator with XRE-family HTH domain